MRTKKEAIAQEQAPKKRGRPRKNPEVVDLRSGRKTKAGKPEQPDSIKAAFDRLKAKGVKPRAADQAPAFSDGKPAPRLIPHDEGDNPGNGWRAPEFSPTPKDIKPASEKPLAEYLKPKGRKGAAAGGKVTIRQLVIKLITGEPAIGNPAMIAAVKKEFPESAFKDSHASWYRSQARRGLLTGTKIDIPQIREPKAGGKEAA